eukprot:s5186_g4.t1
MASGESVRDSGTVRMQVEAIELEQPSPTEIAEEGESDHEPLLPGEDHLRRDGPVKKKEKRKRGENVGRPGNAQVIHDDENDEDLDSPSKRPLRSGDVPLTGNEIRALLLEHVTEMKSAWSTFRNSVQTRLDHVEGDQKNTRFEVGNLQARTRVVEKDLVDCKQQTELNTKHLDELTEEVKNMKVHLAAGPKTLAGVSSHASSHVAPPGQVDPWGDYLRRKQQPDKAEEDDRKDRGDVLTEEEKRTLVLGGWLQDTKRGVIEEEAAFILQLEEAKPLLDTDKIMVYGPRRSVGMLKFTVRDGETAQQMKDRMWEFVKCVSKLKHQLPSTRSGSEARTMWASFVKTKTARARSAHISMVRRVTMALACDVVASGAAGAGVTADHQTAFDCDWNLGTIWAGVNKLASATHRVPKDEEHVLMSGGWVSVTAVARAAGCSTEEAKRALELEL